MTRLPLTVLPFRIREASAQEVIIIFVTFAMRLAKLSVAVTCTNNAKWSAVPNACLTIQCYAPVTPCKCYAPLSYPVDSLLLVVQRSPSGSNPSLDVPQAGVLERPAPQLVIRGPHVWIDGVICDGCEFLWKSQRRAQDYVEVLINEKMSLSNLWYHNIRFCVRHDSQGCQWRRHR